MKDDLFRQQLAEELKRDVEVVADVFPQPQAGEIWTALLFNEAGQVCQIKVRITALNRAAIEYLPGFSIRVVHCQNDRGLPFVLPLANLREKVN